MARSTAFYRDVLGLRITIESPAWTQFDLGGGSIALHSKLNGSESPLGIHGKGWLVGLRTDDIRALKHRLAAVGAVIHGGYHDVPGGVVLDFSDPDGNVLEAFQGGITTGDLV